MKPTRLGSCLSNQESAEDAGLFRVGISCQRVPKSVLLGLAVHLRWRTCAPVEVLPSPNGIIHDGAFVGIPAL